MKNKLLLVLTLSLGFLGCLNAFEEGYKSVLNTLHDLEEQDKKENNDKKKKISTYCNLCKMECYDVSFFLEHKEIIHAGYQDNIIEIVGHAGDQDNPIKIDDDANDQDNQKFACKQFVCKACDSTFNNKEFLVSHHRFYCKTLQKDHKEERKVLKHRIDNNELKATSTYCLKCNVEYETAYYKKRHNQEFHTGPKDFPCVFCVKSFDSQSALTGHANRDHKEELSTINNFVCHDCGKSYEKKCQLIQHFRYSICTRKISDAIKKDDKDDAQFAIKRNKVESSTIPVTITHPTTSTRTTLINDDNDHYQGEIDKVEAAIILLNMKNKKN